MKSVGAGGTHALALTVDGAAWAWGNNNTGQLGDGGVCGKTCPTPVKVTTLTGATALTGGYVHSLAVIGDGTMRSWGRNAAGEVGDGTTTVRATPVTVTGLSGITAATTTTTSAAYTYDGHGTRTSRTIGALTQRFAWDTHGGVPLVLTDGTTSYLYDDAGILHRALRLHGRTHIAALGRTVRDPARFLTILALQDSPSGGTR